MLGDEKGWDEQTEVRTGSGEESGSGWGQGCRGEGDGIRRTFFFMLVGHN